MLKHLYKTLLISVLSGSLLTLQSSVVLAAGTNTTDSNGVITNTQTHKFDKIKDEDMLASLGMLGGGFIAGRMIQAYKPITNDVMIAGAAGVAFIAGEILSNVKFKGTIDEMTVEVQKKSDGTVNEEQVKRLQDLKKSYEEAKKTTKTKKTLQMASAVAFGVAAAYAGYLAYTEYSLMAACYAGIQTAVASCSNTGQYLAAFKILDNARQYPGVSSLKEAKTTTLEDGVLGKPFICTPIAATPVDAAAQVAAGNTAINTPCQPALKAMAANQVFAFDITKLTASNSIIDQYLQTRAAASAAEFPVMSKQPEKRNYLDIALSLFISRAEASWLPLLGLGGGVAAAFLPILAGTAAYVDLWMFVPFNRIIVFGALGGIAMLAAKSSDNTIKKLDDNIAKIDTILQDLDKNAKGVKAQNVTQQQIKIATIDSQNQSQIPFNSNSNTATPCMTSNNTTNCASTTDQLKNMPGFANLPDSFKDIASQSTTLGDKLSGATGVSGSTLASADALASKANAVSKLLKGRQAALEKLNKGFDTKKQEEKFLSGLKNNLKNNLRKQGATASGMMASIGSSGISGAGSASSDLKNDISKVPVPAGGVIDIAAKGDHAYEKDKTLDLNFKDVGGEAPAVDMSGGTVAKAPEYQIDSNEINGQNGPSLFEVISSRYIKSGYPKLLEEETAKKE